MKNFTDIFYGCSSEVISSLIGIADLRKNKWSCGMFVGGGNILLMFEKGKGVIQEAFDKLEHLHSIDKTSLQALNSNLLMKMDVETFQEATWNDIEFFLYNVNIIEMCKKNKVKPTDFLKNLKFSFSQIEHFVEGDVVSFERGLYHHHAVLTDTTRMSVTHRMGEPENPGTTMQAVASFLGCPTSKALVREDFLIEVAGLKRLFKCNEKYDEIYMPRRKEEVVNEAQKRIGETGYSVLNLNCQNFVSECRNGNSYSPEVERILQGAKYSAWILTGGLAAGLSFMLKKKVKRLS